MNHGLVNLFFALFFHLSILHKRLECSMVQWTSQHIFPILHPLGMLLCSDEQIRRGTYFEVAVGIEEQVGWLEITVEDVGRVHTLEGAECLVDEVLAVVVAQILGPDHSMHIRLHQLLNQVPVVCAQEK